MIELGFSVLNVEQAWFMEESAEDQRLPHHRNPKEFVSLDHLAELGVLYWHLNPSDYENDEELQKIRESRGYSYMDLLDLCPEKVENYEQKLKNFYTEHIHGDEEIRYCLEGSGYFDVRDKDDRWIRIWIRAGDLIVLPAGIYHRFTLDSTNYIKLMRLFVGEPVWTPFNRPQEDHPARKEYIKSLTEKSVVVFDSFPTKMLAVFDKSVARAPDALQSPHSDGVSALKDGCLSDHFASVHPGTVTVNLGSTGLLAYSLDRKNPILPRLFAVVEDIFCLFQGHIENVALLKQQYGLNKTANEVIIVIEAYRTLRDRRPYPADQVVRDLNGKFAFILYDSSAKTTFLAADADGSVPFYWGSDSDGNLVLADDVEVVKKGCGKSFAPFPKGCFFTTSGGLRSYEHPLNELKPVPRVDSSGQVCGANFKVDSESKKETSSIPRVGSAANWSSHY